MRPTSLNVRDFGALGDGEADDAPAIQEAALAAADLGVPLVFPSGTYHVATPVLIEGVRHPVHWIGLGSARIVSTLKGSMRTADKHAAFRFFGQAAAMRRLAANAPAASRRIVPDDVAGLEPGMLVGLLSTKAWYHDPRAPQGFVPHNAGRARGGGSDTLRLSSEALDRSYAGLRVTLIAGTGAGQARRIVGYDLETRTATIDRPWKVVPDDTSRYVVPQSFKGELHRIADIRGGKLELQAPLWDGYDVVDDGFGDASEEVSLSVYRPITVMMENLEFEWVRDRGTFQMLHILYGARCWFRDVRVRNARGPAIQVERCYDCSFDDLLVEGADGKFTGYGLVSQCGSFITVRRGRFYGCRRAVDWSCTYNWVDPYPSRGCRVEDSWNFGGGFRQDGREWGAWAPGVDLPDDTIDKNWMIDNFGFGSHGPADNNEYINNRVANAHCGIMLRGRSERVTGNRFYGRLDFGLKVWFGSNHVIQDNHYVHPSVVGDREEDAFYTEWRTFDSSAWNAWMPRFFIQVVGTRNYNPMAEGYLDISRNTARGVRRGFIQLVLSGADSWEDINLKDNHVTFWAMRDEDPVFLVDSNNAGTLRRFTDTGNRLVVRRGSLTRYRTHNPIERESCVVEPEGRPRDWLATSARVLAVDQPIGDAAEPGGRTVVASGPVRPVYKGAKYRCRAELTVTRTDGPGDVAVLLMRGRQVVAATVATVGAAGQRVQAAITAIDDPMTAGAIAYSVRVGPIGEGEVVVNPVREGDPGLLKSLQTARLLVEEKC